MALNEGTAAGGVRVLATYGTGVADLRELLAVPLVDATAAPADGG